MLSTCCFYFSEDEAEIKSLWEDLFIYFVSNIVELIMK